MAAGLRLGAGLARFRWRRHPRPSGAPAMPAASAGVDRFRPDETIAALNHAELGEMAAVAIEMLDLIGRRRRRGS